MSVPSRLKSRLILLIPGYWACLFDEIITITHQPKEYWKGNLKVANEGNPFGAFMMANHISGIFVICFIWLIIIGLIGYYIPRKYLKTFALFVLLAHTWGASTWLSSRYSFWSVMAFVLINSILFVQAEKHYLRSYKAFSFEREIED